MLSFLKKPSDKSSGVTMPAWHPNFRNLERLPDTKAVRTSFFINVLAIFIASSLAIYVGYREYELTILKSDVANALVAIRNDKPASEKAVSLYKQFQEEEKKVMALRDFLAASNIVVSDFILQIGAGLPPAISLTTIDYKATSVVLRGSIEGAPDEASGRAISYVESLRKDDAFNKLFATVTLTNIVRDPGTGRMQFVIDLSFAAPAKKPSAGKK
ncbi:MAG: hypothetical protein K0R17_1424 [Rariglobus sp.]|jgi:hypothetical protein|nr:hypothetical protein [Rariglobus sp.]